MRSRVIHFAASSAALASACGLLAWAAPNAIALLSARPSATAVAGRSADELVATVAGVQAWLLLAWLATSTALTILGRLPGAIGRRAARLARRITPTLVRRALEGALGVAIASTSLAPAAALAAPRTRPAPVEAPSPYDRPAVTAPRPKPTPVPLKAVAPTSSPAVESGVVVRRGDTLWSIASAALGEDADDAAVDVEWRRWYAANREAIGADPDLIVPGLRLQPPKPAPRS